jgi:hypothetical protein
VGAPVSVVGNDTSEALRGTRRITAIIAPGSSEGPLFNSQGQTADRVLIHVYTELGAKDLLNNRMAYVAVSRGAYRCSRSGDGDPGPNCIRNTDLALPAQSLQSSHPYHRGAGMARNFRPGLADP